MSKTSDRNGYGNGFVFVVVIIVLVMVSILVTGGANIFKKEFVTLKVTCSEPPETSIPTISPSRHPIVQINQKKTVENQWITISGPFGSATVSWAEFSAKGEKIVFDGWIGDIVDGKVLVFDPGLYTLSVLTHERGIGYPEFAKDDIIQTTMFTISDCSKSK